MVSKYSDTEVRWLYFSLRDRLHIEGYYDSSLSFEDVARHLADLQLYIRKVEKPKT